jgi:hypothetical protein
MNKPLFRPKASIIQVNSVNATAELSNPRPAERQHVARSRFDIAKTLLSLFWLQYTQEIMQKLNTRSTLHPRLFPRDKFINEETWGNVAL